MRTWKVIEWGRVPQSAATIEYGCPDCGYEALLPVLGIVIADLGHGLVFDVGPHALPDEVQCRRCRRRYAA